LRARGDFWSSVANAAGRFAGSTGVIDGNSRGSERNSETL
jgi:hypothetical protein